MTNRSGQGLKVTSIAGSYQFGTAAFGPPVGNPGVTGQVLAAVDESNALGLTTTDGCTAFTNAAAMSGKIALIERGTCTFGRKTLNAQLAGAIGVIIYNNAANVNSAPPGMAADTAITTPITITAVSLTRADGLAVLGQPTATARISLNLSIRAGADPLGRARLYMPFPVAPGSSGSHYDSIARRNLLMEPAINSDLTHNLTPPDDLTLPLLTDVGWFPDSDLDGLADDEETCDLSNLQPQVIIDGCNTEVANTLMSTGCTVSDLIANCAAGASNHGNFVSCVAHLGKSLKDSGVISDQDKASIQRCAAKSSHP